MDNQTQTVSAYYFYQYEQAIASAKKALRKDLHGSPPIIQKSSCIYDFRTPRAQSS